MPLKTKPEAIAQMEDEHLAYSKCVKIGNHFHFSGVVAINPDFTPHGDFEDQIEKIGLDIKTLLVACGLTFNDVYSATIMLAGNMEHYMKLNWHWRGLFAGVEIMPRRKVFAVTELPFGCAVEIEFDAVDQSK